MYFRVHQILSFIFALILSDGCVEPAVKAEYGPFGLYYMNDS